jgi:hypothetical protein
MPHYGSCILLAKSCIICYILLKAFRGSNKKRGKMATLQVREIDDGLYNILKTVAKKERRSLSLEVVSILESYVRNPLSRVSDTTEEFIALCGSWQDSRSTGEIIKDIKSHRRNSSRFGDSHAVFD